MRLLEVAQDLLDIPIDEDRAALQLAGSGRFSQVDAGVDRPFVFDGHAPKRILDDTRRVPAHPELQEQEPSALVPPQEVPVPPRGEVPGFVFSFLIFSINCFGKTVAFSISDNCSL